MKRSGYIVAELVTRHKKKRKKKRKDEEGTKTV